MSRKKPTVLLIAPVLPFPPDRGGKADVWRRALALRNCGATVLLACPCNGDISDKLLTDAAAVAGIELMLYKRVSLANALRQWLHSRLGVPFFTARRMPKQTGEQDLIQRARNLGINVVVSEGPWLWPLAKTISRELGCPVVYRSHNIEATYMRRQRELECSWLSRTLMAFSFCGLEHFERSAIAEADMLLDISADDLVNWNHPCGRCLPPIPAPLIANSQSESASGVLFLGNLRAPNNLAGLKMLLEEVLPVVRSQAPGLSFHVVGSGPDAETERWIAKSGTFLHKDVADPMGWLMNASCIVNPVRDGSGVQLKMLDMLQTNRPVITFKQGLRGLPTGVRDTVTVVATPTELANAILDLHREGFPPIENRGPVRETFDSHAFFRLLSEVVV